MAADSDGSREPCLPYSLVGSDDPPAAPTRSDAIGVAASAADQRSAPPDEASLLARWDPDVERAARYGARRLGGSHAEAREIAQVVRIVLWRAIRKSGVLPTAYARTVIANAVRSALRRERAGLTMWSAGVVPIDRQFPCGEPADRDRTAAVERWAETLPPRLRELYELLYVHGYSQREAATRLGVTQPRVSQLHQQLLRSGRSSLADLSSELAA